MSIKRKSPLLAIAFLFTLMAMNIFSSNAFAQVDLCETKNPDTGNDNIPANLPPGAQGLTGAPGGNFGGWSASGSDHGSYQMNMSNAAAHTTGNRINVKHSVHQNSNSLDAKALYCWSKLKDTVAALQALTLNPTKALKAIAIHALVDALTNFVCSITAGITADIHQALSIGNNLLCLPLPKLSMPQFRIPGLPSTHCNGTSLLQFQTAPNGMVPNNNGRKILWKLWNGTNNTQQ